MTIIFCTTLMIWACLGAIWALEHPERDMSERWNIFCAGPGVWAAKFLMWLSDHSG